LTDFGDLIRQTSLPPQRMHSMDYAIILLTDTLNKARVRLTALFRYFFICLEDEALFLL